MRLYEVEYTYVALVYAESRADAIERGQECTTEDAPDTVSCSPWTPQDRWPDGWSRDCIPWGVAEQRSIGQILDEETE